MSICFLVLVGWTPGLLLEWFGLWKAAFVMDLVNALLSFVGLILTTFLLAVDGLSVLENPG